MLTVIQICKELEPEAVADVINPLDEIIEDMMVVARARRTRLENAEDEQGEEPSEELGS